MKTQKLTMMAICITLLCISSYIAFPLPFTPTPVTAQTVMINVIALLLKPKEVITAVGLYLLIGLIGFPVFAGGTSGLAPILSLNGGFILAFLIVAPIMSLIKEVGARNFKSYLLITVFVGMPIIYLIGALWMALVGHMDIKAAMSVAVLPFMLGDMLKCFIASILVLRLQTFKVTKQVMSYE